MLAAPAAGHRHRVYDAVILRRCHLLRPLAAYTIEYLLLGTATALFGVLRVAAGWLIVADLMHLRFTWQPAGAGGGGPGGVATALGIIELSAQAKPAAL